MNGDYSGESGPEKPELNTQQLTARILNDLRQLVQTGRISLPYGAPWWLQLGLDLLRGDAPVDSATLSFIPSTSTVTVTVKLPPASGRTTLVLTASQNNTSTELATSSSAPSGDQIGSNYGYTANQALVVKLTYFEGSARKCKLAEFVPSQVDGTGAPNMTMYDCPAP